MKRFLILTALALVACSDSPTSVGSEGALYTVSTVPMSMSYSGTGKIQTGDGFYLSGYRTCGDSGVYKEVWQDTSYYTIASNKMNLWQPYDCKSEVLTGGTSLLGSWMLTGEEEDVVGADTSSCFASSSNAVTTGTVTFANNEYSWNLTLSNWCWSAIVLNGADSTYQALGCNQYTYSNNGRVATYTNISVNPSTNEGYRKFEYNGVACTRHTRPHIDLTAVSCTQAWVDYQADTSSSKSTSFSYYEYTNPEDSKDYDAYYACIDSSGFNTTAAAKRAFIIQENNIDSKIENMLMNKLGE